MFPSSRSFLRVSLPRDSSTGRTRQHNRVIFPHVLDSATSTSIPTPSLARLVFHLFSPGLSLAQREALGCKDTICLSPRLQRSHRVLNTGRPPPRPRTAIRSARPTFTENGRQGAPNMGTLPLPSPFSHSFSSSPTSLPLLLSLPPLSLSFSLLTPLSSLPLLSPSSFTSHLRLFFSLPSPVTPHFSSLSSLPLPSPSLLTTQPHLPLLSSLPLASPSLLTPQPHLPLFSSPPLTLTSHPSPPGERIHCLPTYKANW